LVGKNQKNPKNPKNQRNQKKCGTREKTQRQIFEKLHKKIKAVNIEAGLGGPDP